MSHIGCIHPLARQVFVRTVPHWSGADVDEYRCACGFLSRRLILNRFTVKEADARAALPRFRAAAQRMCRLAVKGGLLERADRCQRCERKTQTQGHHYDYSRPLEVEWLCALCHATADGERRALESERRSA